MRGCAASWPERGLWPENTEEFFDRGVRGLPGSWNYVVGTTGNGARGVEVVTEKFGVSLLYFI
jgi:hypothetical protein